MATSQNGVIYKKGTFSSLFVTCNDKGLDVDNDIAEKVKIAAGQQGVMCKNATCGSIVKCDKSKVRELDVDDIKEKVQMATGRKGVICNNVQLLRVRYQTIRNLMMIMLIKKNKRCLQMG